MAGRNVEQMIDYLLAYDISICEAQDDLDDIRYQGALVAAAPSLTPEEPQEKPNNYISGGKETWPRNPSKAKEALLMAQYKCEVDPNHVTFISGLTNQNYVEAHHLIPMKLQAEFNNSLDVPGNITALCPNCHRAIHHSRPEDKQPLIEKLLNLRKDKLQAFGIPISKEKLLKIYGVKVNP